MTLFFELLQMALGTREKLSRVPSAAEWGSLFDEAERQAVAGVVFPVIEELSRCGHKPPLEILYEWIGLAEQLKQQNKVVNQAAVKLSASLKKDGFETCILKGQGNATLYPNPLLRNPGDIDLLVSKKPIGEVIEYVRGMNPEGRALYHHIELGEVNGVEVEVHYRPSYMFYPVHNRRLQRWFVNHTGEQLLHEVELPEGAGRVCVPTPEFNVVFQLSHVYNHFLHEGIGLRQIVDYFFLLRREGEKDERREGLEKTLRYLGLEKIAGAVMWVLNEVLGLEEKYLIAPKDEKRGKALLVEIMKGGNFGFYDAENLRANSAVKKNIQRIKRDLRLVRYFPSECLWEPAFRIYHFFWRMKYN